MNPFKKRDLSLAEYWDRRLRKGFDLRGVGHQRFSLDYNDYLYLLKQSALEKLIHKHDILIQGKSVVDIGTGTGYFLEFFVKRHAADLTGIDISTTSINLLNERFPDVRLIRLNIGEDSFPAHLRADIVCAFDVMYHILTDRQFEFALKNIISSLSNGGYLFVTDSFKKALDWAPHVRHRELEDYKKIFNQEGLKIIDLQPVFYVMNRQFIPFLGPWLLNRIPNFLYSVDRKLQTWDNVFSRILSNLRLLVGQKST